MSSTALDKSRPVTLSGKFNTNLKQILQSHGYKVIPVLSSRSQLILGDPPGAYYEAGGQPHLTETDVLAALGHVSLAKLWVDLLKPSHISHIIGHTEQIKTLWSWITSWPANGVAALITGPPGIGKTTTAHLLAQAANYAVTEYNASDARSASAIKNLFVSGGTPRLRKEIVIMDEVDGMSSSDKGGIGALAAVIKSGNCPPMICIANDSGSPKMRPLHNCCLDVKFTRPMKTTIADALLKRLPSHPSITREVLLEMCEKSRNDIRAIINTLQFNIGHKLEIAKDEVLSYDAYYATQALVNKRTALSWTEAEQLAFVDYSMIPLMVSELYPSACGNDMQRLAEAADLVSCGDQIDSRIHKQQAWNLLPDYIATTISVTKKLKGACPPRIFPQWLGKNSRYTKNAKNIAGISKKLRSSEARLDYWTPINIIASANSSSPEAFKVCLKNLSLSRDDYFDVLLETSFDPITIGTKEKAAITRAFNKSTGGGKKNKVAAIISNSDSDSDNDDVDELDSDDDIAADGYY